MKRRILAPPSPPAGATAAEPASAWGGSIRRPKLSAANGTMDEETEGGLRREPELGAPDSVETVPSEPVQEPPPSLDDSDAETAAAARLRSRVRQAARQASLDPDDGIPL